MTNVNGLIRRSAAILSIALVLLSCQANILFAKTLTFRDEIKIRDSDIYVDGKRFFINAVGYAPWRPGQWPGKDTVDLSLIEEDFKRIEKAGFNSVRTWDALNPAELALAKKYNLKIIQGIWLDPSRDFSDPYFIRDSVEYARKAAGWSRPYNNVIMYMVMTEPRQEAVLGAGADKTVQFFKNIKSAIQLIDNKPVSMDSWITVGFMDHSMWDVVTFNAFMFVPESINKSIGFREYVRWFKEIHAPDKPLLIGETGGFSISSKKLNDTGFGGNSEDGQAAGNIKSVKESIAAGAAGVCTVAWGDTWHYPSDPSTHNDHPWEWDGIIGFKDSKDLTGTPRKVYYEMQKFNNKHLPKIIEYFHAARNIPSNYRIAVHPIDENYKFNGKIKVKITTADKHGKLLSGKEVKVGFFLPVGWKEEVKSGITDAEGAVEIECGLTPDDAEQYLIVSAGIAAGANRPIGADIAFIQLQSTRRGTNKGFFIYEDKDSPSNHFYSTGWTGDYEDLALNDDFQISPNSGKSCIKIEYSAKGSLGGGWAGIYWQNPAFNWEKKEGGMDLGKRSRLIFWAKGDKGGERIEEIGLGGNPPNSTKIKLGPVILSNKWQQFSIDLSGQDLSCVINGLYLFLRKDANSSGCAFYLDDIEYE